MLSQRHFSTSQMVYRFSEFHREDCGFEWLSFLGSCHFHLSDWLPCVMLHSEYILELLIIFCLVLILSVLLSVAALLYRYPISFVVAPLSLSHCQALIWRQCSIIACSVVYLFVIYNFFETDMYFLGILGETGLTVWFGWNSLFIYYLSSLNT
jgi:hypothetical protein